MSERPFMQLYVSDFLGDTLQLSTEQLGAYMLILMAMWNAGGTLPDDEKKLARIARMSVKKWRANSGDLLAFFDLADGHLSHNRLTKELQKSERKSQSRASAGEKGGRAKALKGLYTVEANASRLLKHSPDTITRKNIAAQQSNEGDAREPDLTDRLLEAAGVRGNPSPALAFPGPIIALLQQGYDLERDILPAIRSKPKTDVRSWQWFVPIITEFVAKREAIPARPPPRTEDWTARLQAWREGGTWGAWGPKPGEAGCRVPAELLQERAA